MSRKTDLEQKKFLAKLYYTKERLDQNIAAKKAGVSTKTMSKWVGEFGWKKLRESLVISKERTLTSLLHQAEQLTLKIENKKPGEQFADTTEMSVLIQYGSLIRQFENNLNIADVIEALMRFLRFMQPLCTTDFFIELTGFAEEFINDQSDPRKKYML